MGKQNFCENSQFLVGPESFTRLNRLRLILLKRSMLVTNTHTRKSA